MAKKTIVSKKPAAKASAKAPVKPAKKHTGRALGRGLGAGVGALIDPPAPVRPALAVIAKPVQESAEKLLRSVLQVPITEIERSPWQPRQDFDEENLLGLAESIKTYGVINPLICRKLKNGRFELIGGERRLRASLLAGLTHVPVTLQDAEDRKAAEMAIVENIQREDLDAIEEAEGYRTLIESFGLTQNEVADRVGRARTSVTNALRLLELPDDTKALVARGQLSAGHAKALLGLAKTEDRIRLGRQAVSKELSVRALEREVQRVNSQPAAAKPSKSDLPEAYLKDLTDKLHSFFGTAIRLTPGKTLANGRRTKGVLEVDFYDNSDLDRILSLLGVKLD